MCTKIVRRNCAQAILRIHTQTILRIYAQNRQSDKNFIQSVNKTFLKLVVRDKGISSIIFT